MKRGETEAKKGSQFFEKIAARLGGETEIVLGPTDCTGLMLTTFPKYDFEA